MIDLRQFLITLTSSGLADVITQFGDTMKRMSIVLAAPLFLGGCMMLGMGGTGSGGGMHEAANDARNGQTLVRESVVNGIGITVAFPPYASGDKLAYTVTLRDTRDQSPISNASLVLVVTADATRNQGSRSVQSGAHAGHGEPSTAPSQETVGRMTFTPEAAGNGTYVFQPSITTPGAYRFLFVLERAGTMTMDPQITVEQTVHLDSRGDQHSGTGDHMGSRRSPAVLLGIGAMALMMLFAMR